MRKKFDKQLYQQNDAIAKSTAISWLATKRPDIKIVENSDQYGLDLIAKVGDTVIGFIECEIKHTWEKDRFPFDTVQVPERKSRYLTGELPIFMFMINDLKTKAALFTRSSIVKSPLKTVNNVYVASGEKFFQVPLHEVIFIDL